MSFYLSQFITYLLLPSFLSGLLYSTTNTYSYRQQILISFIGIFLGVTLFLVLPWRQQWILMVASLAIIVYLIVLFSSLFTLFKKPNLQQDHTSRFFLPIIQILLFFCASYFWARNGQLTMLTSTNVINTDMVLNSLMPILGFTLVMFIFFSLKSVLIIPHFFNHLLIIIVSIIALLPLSGEWMLVMVKLNTNLLELFNLTYIARVNYYIWAYPYIILIFFLLMVIYYWHKDVRPSYQVKQEIGAIEYRIYLANKYKVKTYLRYFITLFILLFSILLWWDLVASKPVQRSEATEVTLSSDKNIVLDIKQEKLNDGELHRYSWIASDGKEVRFFIIRRYPDQEKYGVVFDSCMLCGDAGYAKQGNNVVCLSCGVHIFIPSIGRKGGCNPIPISEWKQTNDSIIISQKSLEEGLRYFNTVHSIDVVDPVNGGHVINTEAEYQYQYGTKTYFFTDKQSYETFRNDPLMYIKE